MSSSPCTIFETCTDLINSYECIDIDECTDTSCYNNGRCIDNIGAHNYTCDCSNTGYHGERCTIESCVDQCKNNGTCIAMRSDPYYYCDCSDTGYYDYNCSTPFIVEPDDVYDSSPCFNDALCISSNDDDTFSCICDINSNYEGKLCNEVIFDDCSSNPCENDGICSDLYQSYICTCDTSKYIGEQCEVILINDNDDEIIEFTNLTEYIPIAILDAPSNIGNCEDLLLDASSSYNILKDDILSLNYQWYIYNNTISNFLP